MQMQVLDVSCPEDSVDPALVDLPRYRSAHELNSTNRDQKILCATLRWNLNGHLKIPHFVVLTNPASNGVYTNFWCSCGSSIRDGIPCRHYWAAILSEQGHLAAFHLGLVNDLWFKEAQPRSEELQLFCSCSGAQQ